MFIRRLAAFLLSYSLLIFAGCAAPEAVSNTHRATSATVAPTAAPVQTEILAITAAVQTLAPSPTAPAENPTVSPAQGITIMYVCLENIGSTLTIRSAPSSSSDAAGSLRHRDRVEVLGISGGWAKIASGGTQRYVKAEYLMQKQPAELSKISGTTPRGKQTISGIKSPVLKVYKHRRTLELWDGSKLAASWRIALGWKPEGHKREEGDGRTPEGAYYVCTRNANSSYYKSLGVSYPNKEDANAAFADGRINESELDAILSAIGNQACPPWNTRLGGAIMIHGNGSESDWTAGCIAVEDEVMDNLWECCKMGTKIFIYP